MNAKEIGRTAGRIFAYHLKPNWILRSQEDQEDYGVDMEIEIASSGDKATGFIFKVQVKGQEHVDVINNKTKVSFSLPVDRLRYYMKQMEAPIILAVVDTTDEKIFWCSLQDSEEIECDLKRAIEKNQQTVAVHLDIENRLPERSSELLAAVEQNMNWLRLNGLGRLTGSVGELLSRSRDDVLEGLLDESKKLHFAIFNQKFERLLFSGKHDELMDITKKVIHSSTELVETRLSAGFYIDRVLRQTLDRSDPSRLDSVYNLYGTMLHIVRNERTPAHLRRFVILLIRILRMQESVNSDYHYFVSAKHFPVDSLTGWIVASTRVQVSARASTDVIKTVHLVNRAVLAGQHGLLLDALPRFVPFMALFVLRLKDDKLTTQAETLLSWLQFCVDLTIEVARAMKNTGALAEAIGAYAILDMAPEGKATRIEQALKLASTLEHPALRAGIEARIRELAVERIDEKVELSPDTEIELFRTRAIGLGMDLDNPNDRIGQIIQQGLLDYNPERVIKNCDSLVMIPGRSLGVPAQMVGLPTAGMKVLHCLKKGHTVGGWRLDEIYSSMLPGFGFKPEYCDSCELRNARSEDWKWSSKWQRELAEEYSEKFRKISLF